MSGADGSLWFDTQIDSKNFNKGIKTINSQASGLQKTISNLGKTIITAFGVTQIVQFAKTSIQASNEIENSLIGLQSIVEGQGKSFQKAQKFVEEYVSDGLVPLNNAATAYKNLAARGYNEQQIQSVMIALKDSAAFGRQAHLTMGEAIQNASEGLKNENSILVDNAGVTKNVAKMWEDYAKSIGTTAAKLTQQQKIQAEVTGILEETKFQTGDAAKIAETYSGQILKLQFEFSNLQVAVGNFLKPIITTFLPVINASVQAVTRFANSLANVSEALFGKQTQQANTIATSVENQKELTQETKNTAKAADKTQASFDEIQKLTQSSAEGTSAGAVAGITQETVSAEADVVQNELNNIQLPEGLVTLIDSLKEGIQWFGENIVLPLKDWSINDVLPSFFNMLSSSINVLNPILQSFANIFTPIWESLLKPLSSWTGGVIIDILNLLADALKKIGDWMINNQQTVDNIVASLITFFGLWKVTELIAFIQMAGGVTNVIKVLTATIWKNVAAKIADKAQTIAIIGLYAKDFVVGLVKSTAALAKQVVQFGVSTAAIIAHKVVLVASTAATTLATIATTAFGAAVAFLTSPIGLVVLAIGALIAIVALLIANWDTVKAVAQSCWEGIKNVWSVVATWFNNNIVQPLASFFGGLWEGIKSGASVLAEFMKKHVINPIVDLFKGLYNSVVGIVEGIVNGFIGIINTFIRGINKVIDTINAIPGVSLPQLKTLEDVKIPKLATGTVVPANYGNFLAMLGDNKKETEVVSPLSTMKQALKEALAESGQNITINFEESSIGDLVRILKPYIDKENRRVGSSTRVIGGAY